MYTSEYRQREAAQTERIHLICTLALRVADYLLLLTVSWLWARWLFKMVFRASRRFTEHFCVCSCFHPSRPKLHSGFGVFIFSPFLPLSAPVVLLLAAAGHASVRKDGAGGRKPSLSFSLRVLKQCWKVLQAEWETGETVFQSNDPEDILRQSHS